jgi:hypothetical protein
MVEQLRRAYSAILAALSQPSQLPDLIHQTINKAIQNKACVEDRLIRRNIFSNNCSLNNLYRNP